MLRTSRKILSALRAKPKPVRLLKYRLFDILIDGSLQESETALGKDFDLVDDAYKYVVSLNNNMTYAIVPIVVSRET